MDPSCHNSHVPFIRSSVTFRQQIQAYYIAVSPGLTLVSCPHHRHSKLTVIKWSPTSPKSMHRGPKEMLSRGPPSHLPSLRPARTDRSAHALSGILPSSHATYSHLLGSAPAQCLCTVSFPFAPYVPQFVNPDFSTFFLRCKCFCPEVHLLYYTFESCHRIESFVFYQKSDTNVIDYYHDKDNKYTHFCAHSNLFHSDFHLVTTALRLEFFTIS